jgi:O-acetyl-ADP-ribose deacetylase (regulator of RNase III)
MSEITYLVGDATVPQTLGPKIVAHICNDIGAWGKGFVLAVSRRWSEPKQAYRAWYRDRVNNDFELGAVQFVQVESEIWVANMIGQHGIRDTKNGPPIRYNALERCLGRLAGKALGLNASVHMPRIGCGLAGGRWDQIEPIIIRQLCQKRVAAFVYDYQGAG